jgi:hypothetical protein
MRPGQWMGLIKSISNIDFTPEAFLKESILICRETKGGFTFRDIKDLDYDEYLLVVNEADRLQKPIKEKENRDG